MKKWLAIFSVTFIISLIICSILAGRVYYRDLKTYSDHDKKELDAAALKNIYIKSYIPIDVYPTEGKPYVEFNQTFIDLVGIAPKYELRVESKEDSTYINLNEIQEIFLWLGVKENKVKLSLYLPQTLINRLSIQNASFLYSNKEMQMINLEGIDINELDLKMNNAEVNLNGNYENMNLRLNGGKINIDSKKPAQLFVDGNVEQYLCGEFEKVIIKNNCSDISLDSTADCNAQISVEDANLHLKGKYKRISINGDSNNIDLRSEGVSRLLTKGNCNRISGVGNFEQISLNEDCSEVELQTNIIPSKVQLGGCTNDATLTLTLPSNIPGFTVKYVGSKNKFSKDEFEVYQSYLLEEKYIESDFKLDSSISSKGELLYTYGDGSIPITLNEQEDIAINLIDGGYTSSVQ